MFDISPLHGHLQPGDQQLVTFSFYGQHNVSREVVALCHVEEGPTYEVKLRGEVSVISYSLDPTHVDFGVQVRMLGFFHPEFSFPALHLNKLCQSNSFISVWYVQIVKLR